MIALGIETSCDETSVALVENGRKVLANVVSSSLKEHRPYGGVVPEIASRAQLEVILPCLDGALKKSKKKLKDVDLIAVTRGPGLMGSLLVGLSSAKALSSALKKPLVGVDHVIAHAYAGLLSAPQARLPILSLVVSGGHTVILKMKTPSRVEILGRTLDDAAGEAFDKVAKMLGLGYPGGPEIDKISKNQDPNRFRFSRPFLSKDSLDFSFSGIKTAVYYEVQKLKKKRTAPAALLRKAEQRGVAAGFQEAVCDVLVRKALLAAGIHKAKWLVVGGGVSANSRLRWKFQQARRGMPVQVVFPPLEFCQDNAAMIASLGMALYKEGRRDSLNLSSYSHFGVRPQNTKYGVPVGAG